MKHFKTDLSKTRRTIRKATFDKKDSASRIMVVGFDTEYQQVTESENEVLSYQYAAAVLSDDRSVPLVWEDIVIPPKGKLHSIADLLSVVASGAVEKNTAVVLPTKIYLVGHFTREDVLAFSEFKDETTIERLRLDVVRNTFLNMREVIPIDIETVDGKRRLSVAIRDTMLLAAGGKSLASVGELVGIPKVVLDADPKEERRIKENMRRFRDRHWKRFREYAMTDARICREYTIRIIRQNQGLTDEFKLPITLSALGVTLLERFWAEQGQDVAVMSGREIKKLRSWDNAKGRYTTRRESVLIENLHDYENLLSECYHGGRNEQFQFGPLSHGQWVDYDLTSAYLTAMAMIGRADWSSIREIKDTKELLSYKPIDLAFARIEFEFGGAVKFPCLPVRTENGLVFPLKGTTCVPIAEIKLAQAMGAKVEMKRGLVIQADRSEATRPFLEFGRYCLEERKKAEKGSLENAFWKEIANSTYGKTAQGIKEKRVYDIRERKSRRLPPSRITNPAYAAFISGFCRATISEILDRLEPDTSVCSVTTDGFLSQSLPEDIDFAKSGVMGEVVSGRTPPSWQQRRLNR